MTRNEAQGIVHRMWPGAIGATKEMLINAVLAGAKYYAKSHAWKKPAEEEENGSWAELRERYNSSA